MLKSERLGVVPLELAGSLAQEERSLRTPPIAAAAAAVLVCVWSQCSECTLGHEENT